MVGSKSRAAVKKAPAKKRAAKLSPEEIARIDASIEHARGKPGFEMVRALGELAKLGPYKFKRLKI
ncbi:hypothetical protein [Roseateles sp. LKC17W]|uniref:Uncharacterized protein n=1 Tax=Pelomonas margarita TaxID=3299031 RepID=A0ABW7FFP0_9BURK